MMIRRMLLALGLVSLAGCATIADTAARTPQRSTLNRLIADAGLAETLKGTGPYAVFAPSGEAFEAVPAKTMQHLAANKEPLKAVLTDHVIPRGDGAAGRRARHQRRRARDRPRADPAEALSGI